MARFWRRTKSAREEARARDEARRFRAARAHRDLHDKRNPSVELARRPGVSAWSARNRRMAKRYGMTRGA